MTPFGVAHPVLAFSSNIQKADQVSLYSCGFSTTSAPEAKEIKLGSSDSAATGAAATGAVITVEVVELVVTSSMTASFFLQETTAAARQKNKTNLCMTRDYRGAQWGAGRIVPSRFHDPTRS